MYVANHRDHKLTEAIPGRVCVVSLTEHGLRPRSVDAGIDGLDNTRGDFRVDDLPRGARAYRPPDLPVRIAASRAAAGPLGSSLAARSKLWVAVSIWSRSSATSPRL